MSRKKFSSYAAYKRSKEKERERYYKKDYPPSRWTSEQIKLLLTFDGTDPELAALVQHNVKAIQHKRARLLGREE